LPDNSSILIVDDSADCRELLNCYLTTIGFKVIEAENGKIALAIAQAVKPALILMDLRLPDVDGWAATKQLKADPATQHIAVVAVTGSVMQSEENLARACGCDGFVRKPYDIEALGTAIKAILQGEGREFVMVDSVSPAKFLSSSL
jgi:two-component system cell cycle response regulator DivK